MLQDKGLSQKEFCDITGYKQNNLSNFLTGRTTLPKVDLLQAVAEYFPEVDVNWLLTGRGKLYREEQALKEMLAEEPTATYQKEGEEEDETLRELVRTQKQLLHLMEKRVAQMERNIKQRDPDLARELGLEE